MGRVIKPGRVVIVLHGRHAGRKGVVIHAHDSGTRDRAFSHALVVGISRPPRKITKKMSKKMMEKKSKLSTFIRHVNYNHLMPTRYTLSGDVDTKALIGEHDLHDKEQKHAAVKHAQKAFQELIVTPNEKTGKVSKDVIFFRRRLRF